MELKSYYSLKSGTDVRGVAVRTENENVTLTPEAISDITKAFLKWVADRTGKTELTVAVGNDVRISCKAIYATVSEAVTGSGCNLIYCGMSTTPSMYVLLKESGWNCDASIMITASHLPYQMNGLKFFIPEGGLTSEQLDEVLALAAEGKRLPAGSGTVREESYMDSYCKKLVDTVRTGTGLTSPLFGQRIVVDASNGVGGFFVQKVLQPLGAITFGSENLEPDGNFPAHAPNPENAEAVKALSEAVIRARAELGIIFDTDVDRAALVDGDGAPINRNNLIALTAATVLAERPATIVTDSVTSDGLTTFIESLGGRHLRFKRGYKNVIEKAKKLNDYGEYCPLAMETSGHAAFIDNYFLDDGAYLVCKLLIAYTKQAQNRLKLGDLISSLSSPAEEHEIRVKFNSASEDFKREGARVIEELKYFMRASKKCSLTPNSYEGVRINYAPDCGDGWTLVRMSVHEAVMPINFASRIIGGDRKMAKSLYYILEKYPFLDTRPLRDFFKEEN